MVQIYIPSIKIGGLKPPILNKNEIPSCYKYNAKFNKID